MTQGVKHSVKSKPAVDVRHLPRYLEVNRSILSVIPSGHPIAQKMFRTDHLRGITFSRR